MILNDEKLIIYVGDRRYLAPMETHLMRVIMRKDRMQPHEEEECDRGEKSDGSKKSGHSLII